MKFVQKKIGTLSVLLLCCYALIACSQLQTPALPMVFSLHDLRVGEGFVDPLGYYEANPRLSWRISESATSQFQTAYQIQVASSIAQLLEKPDLWDSHKVNSTDNAWHKYQGERLTSRQKAV
ncbi:MAG: rhamnosidase, partial [Paraglaciecola sp.]|nr:rhamnosidase [Paraglaciecola sp.]